MRQLSTSRWPDHEAVDRRQSVLVVDDDRFHRTLSAGVLGAAGCEAITAGDGAEALERLRSRPFDVVLLDIVMPGMDGFEVLAVVKGDPGLRHIPVVMTSALEESGDTARCFEMGADDYVPKGDPVLLRARVAWLAGNLDLCPSARN